MDQAAFLTSLIVIGVAYQLSMTLWFISRRNEFPLTGRSTSLVGSVAIILMLSGIIRVARSHPNLTLSCEFIQFDRFLNSVLINLYFVHLFRIILMLSGIIRVARSHPNLTLSCEFIQFDRFLNSVLINLYFVRLFRVWYKIFASREKLDAHRLQMNSTSSAYFESVPQDEEEVDDEVDDEVDEEVKDEVEVELEVPATGTNDCESEVNNETNIVITSDGVIGAEAVLDTTDILENVEEEGDSDVENSISAMSDIAAKTSVRGQEAVLEALHADPHRVELGERAAQREFSSVSVELESMGVSTNSNEQKSGELTDHDENARTQELSTSVMSPSVDHGDERDLDLDDHSSNATRTRMLAKTLSWFTHRPYLGKVAFLWKVLGAVTVLNAVLTVALHVLTPLEERCDPLDYGGLYARVLQGVLFLLCIVFAWKVRNVKEGYHIRTEFVLIGIGVVYIVAVLIPREQDRTNLMWLTLLWMGFNYALSATCVYPVAKSYGFEWRDVGRCRCSCALSLRPCCSRSEREASSDTNASSHEDNATTTANASAKSASVAMVDPNNQRHVQLNELLTKKKYKKSRRSFENHLAQEFSIENLLFYDEAVAFFEKAPELSDDEIASYALDVYWKFIAYDAPLELNIRRNEREPIVAELRKNIRNFDSHVRRRRRLKQLNKEAAAANGGAKDDSDADDDLWYLSAWTKKTEQESGATKRDVSRSRSHSRSGVGVVVVGRVSHWIFERTKIQIFRLLAQDSFVRWRRTQRDSLRRTRRDSFVAILTRRASVTFS